MIAQVDIAPVGTTTSVAALTRRLAHALETKEVELAVAHREIAELVRAREREASLRRLGEAQAALAHQMRTPLTVAGLHVDQLLLDVRDDTSDSIAARKRLHKIRASLGAVERQIRNALVFVTGRLGERANFDAGSLVDFLRDSLAPLESMHPIVWDVADSGNFVLDGDRAVLAGAIVNLVENAAAVGGSSVTVRIEVRAVDDGLDVSVTDNGPGMSGELLVRVRAPFVSERTGGTGLGLAIADRVVEAHGGRLTIESAPGQGTRVRILLPRAEEVVA